MSGRNIIIGSKSSYARRDKDAKNPQGLAAVPRPPRELIDIYIGDVFVEAAPRKLLVRFSRVAAETLPKPQQTNNKTATESSVKENEREAEKTPSATTTTATVSKPSNTQLILGLKDAQEYPTTKAIRQCLIWMDDNKKTSNSEPLPGLSAPEGTPLRALINVQAAVLCFDLRPAQLVLRSQIMQHLTDNKPVQADVQFFWEHIPKKDGIVKRMITAYFEHSQKGNYTEEETGAIHEYVEGVQALSQHFYEVEKNRYYQQKRQEREKREADGKAIGGKVEGADITQDGNTGGSQQGQLPRHQQGKGKGKGKADGEAEPTKKRNTTAGGSGDEKAKESTEAKPSAQRWQEAQRKAEENAKK